MPDDARDFWQPWESVANSFEEARGIIHDVFDGWAAEGHRFAWRGHVDDRWPLHSSLYRRVRWTGGGVPDEIALQETEAQILVDLQRWGLHVAQRARLSYLDRLAMLQHYGAPTRLIDITFNPLIGLWFAVEQKWDNGAEVDADKDGRLFAIDVTNRLINENPDYQDWELSATRPWSADLEFLKRWCTQTYAWKPPPLDGRIAAQNGGFLLGGVPQTVSDHGQITWPKGTNLGRDKAFQLDEVRLRTSVGLRAHKIDGPVTGNAVYSIRIAAAAKPGIRAALEKLYGYSWPTLYPDFTGFSQHAVTYLKTRP